MRIKLGRWFLTVDGHMHHYTPFLFKIRFGKWVCDRADYFIYDGSISPNEYTFKEFRKVHCSDR